MSITLQILGALAVVVLLATVLLRPDGIVLPILAIGFVIAAIVTSWRDVEQYRIQKTTTLPVTTVTAPSPPREYPRSGS